MANKEHLKILKHGVEAWNTWREENLQITPDLRKGNLYKADLYEANLYEADLYAADLSGANLNKADLRMADLTGANLSGANLGMADLTGADLYKANLNGAQNLTAKQLIITINWQEAIFDFSLRVEAEKLIGAEKQTSVKNG